MKGISYKKTIFDWLYIIYNFPFLICLEILLTSSGDFVIVKYDSYKNKYEEFKENDRKNFRTVLTIVSTLIYIVIFLLIGTLSENK